MQDRHREIVSRYWGLIAVALLMPLVLYAAIPILPTHDDWAGTTRPDFTPFFTKEHFLFYGYHWRPFDTWVGYLAGRNPQALYPTLNHILVVVGHAVNALLIYRFIRTLGFSIRACNMAALFFFVTPAAMATVLAIDSQNQTYAMMWGIVAFLAYVRLKKGKYVVWPLLVLIATLSKENGLMWALICPILAYGFDFTDQRTLKKDLLAGIGIMVLYALLIVVLPKNIIIHPEYVPDDFKVVKNIVKFLFTTFVTVDYVYLLHEPSRNLLLAAVSLLAAAPFLCMVLFKNVSRYAKKKTVCTVACLVIAIGPHILTVFSMMHTYAALAMLCILIASGVDEWQEKNSKRLLAAFLLFLGAAVTIDGHLTHKAYESGLVGKKMALEAVRKTDRPAKNVFLVIVEDDYPKLSSFCVIPYEAFGWGLATQYETDYQWPEMIQDTTIERTTEAMKTARRLAREKLDGGKYDCAWIVNKENIDVVKR